MFYIDIQQGLSATNYSEDEPEQYLLAKEATVCICR